MSTYSIPLAYLLWLLSGFGVAGFHRFYLGKIGTGLLWLFSGGVMGIGALIDFFRLPTMVHEANLRLEYRKALFPDAPRPLPVSAPRGESVEHAILRVARRNKGPVSASEVALETETTIEEAKKHLDKLVEKNFVELRVRKDGQLIYIVRDFLDKSVETDYEDF